MNVNPSRQRGMTLIGYLLMFTLIGFFVLLTLKLVPIYLEHIKVVSALTSLKKEGDFSIRSKEDILNMLQKRWDINAVERVSAQDVTIVRSGGIISKVQIAYEVVEPVMGNVSVLVTFDDSIEAESGN
jgi:hypothetical protein